MLARGLSLVMLTNEASSLPGLTGHMGRVIPQLWWGLQAPMKA